MENQNPNSESEPEVEAAKPKGKLLTTNQAAEIIGCSVQHVRTLASRGKLACVRTQSNRNPAGYDYQIPLAAAKAYQKRVHKRGWPRGVKRR